MFSFSNEISYFKPVSQFQLFRIFFLFHNFLNDFYTFAIIFVFMYLLLYLFMHICHYICLSQTTCIFLFTHLFRGKTLLCHCPLTLWRATHNQSSLYDCSLPIWQLTFGKSAIAHFAYDQYANDQAWVLFIYIGYLFALIIVITYN